MEGQTDIFKAAFEGNLDGVKNFVNTDKTVINAKDDIGKTPLHWAVSGEKADIVDYLIKAGADINIKDSQNQTALDLAKQKGLNNIIKLLIQKNDSHVEIRKVGLEDIPPLKEVCCRTFFETFADQNTPEDMKKYLETNFSEEQLSKEISTPGSQFYLAFVDDKPVAYLKLNMGEAQTEEQGMDSMEVQRIYVVADCKGHRIGSRLMDQAEAVAVQSKCRRVWLGVWEHNDPAIRFYTRRGFQRFGEHIFVLGDDPQTDYLMEKIVSTSSSS